MNHMIIIFLTVGIVIALLLFLKYYFYENKSNNTTQLIKGPNTPPNDEYYPIIVGDETGSQNLYTNKSKFNYDVVNNILYVDNLQGNLKNKSAFVSNLIKENASNNLLVQRSNNTTSLISPGKVGNVLTSNGSNNVPSWKGIYDDTPGFNSILFRPINQSYYPVDSPYQKYSIASPSTDSNITFSSISPPDSSTYDIVYQNVTINGILSLNGVRINVSGTLTINGTIRHDRGSTIYNTLGVPIITDSSANSLNGNPTNSEAGFGGNGAGENSIGGTNIYPSDKEGGRKLFYQYPNFLSMGYYDINNNFITYKGGASGGRGTNVNYLGVNYRGGDGGAGGGVIHICAKNIVFGPNGKIEAVGGNGGDGRADNTGTIRGGGGGGGGGGLIVIVTDTKNLSPTDTTKFNVSGGNAGLGGNAQKGGDGKVIIFDYL
jgi:hypothetical protein